VFIARQYARSATYQELADSVEHLLKLAGLWIEPDENQK